MKRIDDIMGKPFLASIRRFLSLNLDNLFDRLMYQITSDIGSSAGLVNIKTLNSIRALISNELKKINRIKVIASLKPDIYETNQDITPLYSLKENLVNIAKSLRNLQSEIYEKCKSMLVHESLINETMYKSKVGKEINSYLNVLEDSINQLDKFLR